MRINEQTVRDAMNRRLSALSASPEREARIRQRIAQEEELNMKKKLSLVLVVAIVLVLGTVSAVAAGIVFSSRADASLLADQAVKAAYGLSPAMLGGYFGKTIEEKEDGSTAVAYWGIEDLRYVLGEYTVTVKDGKATVVWSHDGESTVGGLDAEAWGVDQLNDMVAWDNAHHDVSGYYEKAREIAKRHGTLQAATASLSLEEETEALAARYAVDEAASRAAAKLSEAEMSAIAKQAVAAAYGLTNEQMALMTCPQDIEEYYYYNICDGKPVYSVWFYLTQRPSTNPNVFPEFTEGDGIYVVDVNVESGIVERILYDSTLGGNG
ncbi:MAG: hypothetical protein IJ189_07585 [Clostridia bacterium]|nr:hypothetical protein [Clostridia bacterium]